MKIRLTNPAHKLNYQGAVITGDMVLDVPDVSFWRRRLRDGSCQRVDAKPKPKAKPKAAPKTDKATTED